MNWEAAAVRIGALTPEIAACLEAIEAGALAGEAARRAQEDGGD